VVRFSCVGVRGRALWTPKGCGYLLLSANGEKELVRTNREQWLPGAKIVATGSRAVRHSVCLPCLSFSTGWVTQVPSRFIARDGISKS